MQLRAVAILLVNGVVPKVFQVTVTLCVCVWDVRCGVDDDDLLKGVRGD